MGGNKRGSYQRRRQKVTDCFIVEVTEKKKSLLEREELLYVFWEGEEGGGEAD